MNLFELYKIFCKASYGVVKDEAASILFALACMVILTLPDDEKKDQYGYKYIADALYAVNHKNSDMSLVADCYRLAKSDPLAAMAVVLPDYFIIDNVMKLSLADKEYMREVFNSVYSKQIDAENEAFFKRVAEEQARDADYTKQGESGKRY